MRQIPAVLLVATSTALAGPEWIEVGDAPPVNPQPIVGMGPLQLITGSLEGGSDLQDMYLIRIAQPLAFSATTTISGGGFADFDTNLVLLEAPGLGLLANQDAGPGEPGSTFTNVPTDGTPIQITTPGDYIIGISGTGSLPISASGQIFEFLSPFEVSGPDGPGGTDPHIGWDGQGATGDYTIRLTGTEFIPAPGALAPLALVFVSRRRRQA